MTTTTQRRAARALVLLPVISAGLLAVAATGFTAHGNAAASAPLTPERFTVRASAPHLPKQLPAGILALTFVNDTKTEADAGLARANPGATVAEIEAASAASNGQSEAALQAWVRLTHLLTFAGGANSLAPGASETVYLDIRTPGLYGLHVSSDNGPGKDTLFKVTPGAGQHALLPPATTTVSLKDMKFLGLPGHLAAGRTTIRVVNQGPSVHEMAVVRLDAGKTQRDALAYMRSPQGQQGPPAWAHPAGGMDTLAPNQSADVTLNLAPGYYIVVCFLPDAKKQLPHAMEGMIGHFTVS